MKFVLVALLSLSGMFASAQSAKSPSELAQEIADVSSSLRRAEANGYIHFRDAQTRALFAANMVVLDHAAENVQKINATAGGEKSEREQIIDDTVQLQAILTNYLGNKEFHGYLLNTGRINISVTSNLSFNRLVAKIPHLRNVNAIFSGNLGAKRTAEFNSLKTQFYTHLARWASIDRNDTALAAIAKWGNETKVIYPGETFGTEIITTQQLWNLKLP